MAYSEEAKSSPVHLESYGIPVHIASPVLLHASEKVRTYDRRTQFASAVDPSKTPCNSPLEVLLKTTTPLFSALLCPTLLDTFCVSYHSYMVSLPTM